MAKMKIMVILDISEIMIIYLSYWLICWIVRKHDTALLCKSERKRKSALLFHLKTVKLIQ